MSTVIRNGFRLVGIRGLAGLSVALEPWRAECLRRSLAFRAAFVAGEAVAAIDRADADCSARPDRPLSAAYAALWDRRREVERTGRRDPRVDDSFDLCVIPRRRGAALGVAYTERGSWLSDFLALPWVEAWPWWDNTDPPEGVSDRAWERRGTAWSAALGPTGVPARSGLSVDCVSGARDPEPEDVVAAQPPLADRASAIARRKAMARCPLDFEGMGVGERAMAAMGWMTSEAGIGAAAEEASRAASVLSPSLSLEDLVGRQS